MSDPLRRRTKLSQRWDETIYKRGNSIILHVAEIKVVLLHRNMAAKLLHVCACVCMHLEDTA